MIKVWQTEIGRDSLGNAIQFLSRESGDRVLTDPINFALQPFRGKFERPGENQGGDECNGQNDDDVADCGYMRTDSLGTMKGWNRPTADVLRCVFRGLSLPDLSAISA